MTVLFKCKKCMPLLYQTKSIFMPLLYQTKSIFIPFLYQTKSIFIPLLYQTKSIFIPTSSHWISTFFTLIFPRTLWKGNFHNIIVFLKYTWFGFVNFANFFAYLNSLNQGLFKNVWFVIFCKTFVLAHFLLKNYISQ